MLAAQGVYTETHVAINWTVVLAATAVVIILITAAAFAVRRYRRGQGGPGRR